VTVAAVAVNVAVVLPDPTVTEAGTVSDAALLDTATFAPLAFDKITVQVDDPPELSDAGAQLIAVGVGGTVAATNAIEAPNELPPEVAFTTAV
jgi:hypothetical protein